MIFTAEFVANTDPVLTQTSRIATRNHAADLTTERAVPELSHADRRHFLRPTKLLPTEGIVHATATEITRGSATDLEKARALYEWIVDNTFRDPKTRARGWPFPRAMSMAFARQVGTRLQKPGRVLPYHHQSTALPR